mmetsp:Transcript_5825/g.13797  ORF Transcript_5825/g.13797 Transcript_5825/m.13797 type:complete len:211 (-) Transcript_5825:290-922(-)
MVCHKGMQEVVQVEEAHTLHPQNRHHPRQRWCPWGQMEQWAVQIHHRHQSLLPQHPLGNPWPNGPSGCTCSTAYWTGPSVLCHPECQHPQWGHRSKRRSHTDLVARSSETDAPCSSSLSSLSKSWMELRRRMEDQAQTAAAQVRPSTENSYTGPGCPEVWGTRKIPSLCSHPPCSPFWPHLAVRSHTERQRGPPLASVDSPLPNAQADCT